MEISPPATDTTRATAAANTGGQAAPATAIGADFDTFLQMLTVQMQNQDPLNPSDPSDLATQLATFSSVGQQVRTNDLLIALGAQMGALAVSQLASWVGMDARAEVPVRFDGDPVTIITGANSAADRAELVVRDAQGNVLQRQPVDTDAQEIDWAGGSDPDHPLPPGDYDITVEYFSKDEQIATEPVDVLTRIVEARNEDGVPVLVLATGQEVESSKIIGLRTPT